MKSIVNPYAKPVSSLPSSSSRKRARSPQHFRESTSSRTTSSGTIFPKKHSLEKSSATASALIISASDKAGMQGIDRKKIDAIILRESGNSKFMQQQRKRDDKVNQRIASLKEKLKASPPEEYAVTPDLEMKIQGYQAQQPTRSTKVVVDMDMFYMACELLSKPHLHHVPACVGRGMILTSNYKARKYGVRSAMPGFVGDALVEELSRGTQRLIHVPSNHSLYKEKSGLVIETLKKYDPHLRSYSLDEAYLDIGPYLVLYLKQKQSFTGKDLHSYVQTLLKEHQEPTAPNFYLDILQKYSQDTCQQASLDIVMHLRRSVEQTTGGLTCSAGIAPNFGLAKIASDKNKPNGQLFIVPEKVIDFIHPLPVRNISGIGRVTNKILQQVLMVNTAKELYQHRGVVSWLFQPATSEFLLKASVGCFGSCTTYGSSMTEPDEDEGTVAGQKGISRERTFSPEHSWTKLTSKLQEIADKLSSDMSNKKFVAHTLTLKVKLHTFDVWSRAKSLPSGDYMQQPHELFALALELLKTLKESCEEEFQCRLLGIRCSGLVPENSLQNTKPMDKFVVAIKNIQTETKISPENVGAVSVIGEAQPFFQNTNSAENFQMDHKPNGPATPTTASEKKANPINFHPSMEEEEHNTCPLCNTCVAGDNDALNRHIDACLNASTVRQLVQESSSLAEKKRRKLTDFW